MHASSPSGTLSPTSRSVALPRAGAAVLTALVLAAFLPRAWLCWPEPVLCCDSLTYLRLSNALEQGDLEQAFAYLSLNVYPVILLAIRRLGFDTLLGAAWWSVMVSTLTVLPLWGLTRRMFDQRTAALACLLYAVHPSLCAYGPHVTRDPTCWFFCVLFLYLFWRAVAEVRAWLFVAAGAALTLAVHTRSEAWLMAIPLAGWAAWRWRVDAPNRWRVAAGTALCAAVVPASILLVNVTLLRGYPHWELGCTRHVKEMGDWSRGVAPERVASGAPGAAPAPGVRVLRFSTPVAFRKAPVWFVKILTYPYTALVVVGLWTLRRRLWQAWLPLTLVAAAMVSAIAVRMTVTGIDPRYYLTGVLALIPLAAVGLCRATQWLAYRVARRWPARARLPSAAAVGLVVAVVAAGGAEGWATMHRMSQFFGKRAALGQWIADHVQSPADIVSDCADNRLVLYYSGGQDHRIDAEARQSGSATLVWIGEIRPDVVVLWREPDRAWPAELSRAVLERHREIGYRRVPPAQLPPLCQDLVVLLDDGAPAEETERFRHAERSEASRLAR
ncbi:MAG: glycosyltransferase family 39 protein [Pirellulales bacterium]|nr:glycosyltransferase family 39 protein [Pirellulales bacterium]